MNLNSPVFVSTSRATAILMLFLVGTPCVTSATAQQPVIDEVPGLISGTVLLPSGEPAVNAPVILYWNKPFAGTKTANDGSFTLKVDVERIESEVGDDWPRMAIASTKEGSGPSWEILGRVTDTKSVELQLVEDTPITGRILDQQGRPVQGATVTIQNLHRATDENLEGFLKASRDQPTQLWLYERDSMLYLSPEAVLQLQGIKDQRRPSALTDADGRFSLSGFGKDRSLFATIQGPGITKENVFIITRPRIEARWKRGPLSRATQRDLESGAPMRSVYAANFHHLAAPALTIRGTLTDAETGKPVEGMRLSARMKGHLTPGIATSDKDGRYELNGLPTEGEMRLSVLNPGDKPYLDAEIERDVTATEPIGEIDFELDRGVIVTGVVTDRKTGEPVAGNIGYLSWPENEHLSRLHQPYDTFNTQGTDKQGSYKIVVLPGPGVLAFQARNRTQYDFAESSDFGFQTGQAGMFLSGNRGYFQADEFHFLQRIEPATSASEIKVDISIGRGPVLTVHATKPDGSPFSELKVRGIRRLGGETVRGGKFDVRGLESGEPRTVLIRDIEHGFAGVFDLKRTDKSETVELEVKKAATVSGHIVDADGRPRSRWMVAAVSEGTIEAATENNGLRPPGLFEFDDSSTDADGYFRLTGLPSGIRIEIATAERVEGERPTITTVKSVTLRPNQQLDLGQLIVK